jgi:predicted lysophospholipase L1 biosynthesis ABC-type transport system permease subunit
MMFLPQGNNTCNQDKKQKTAENSEQPQPGFRVQHQKKRAMKTFLASSTVFLTILSSFAFGIACGYVVIVAILRAFAHKKEPAAAPAHAVIATSAQGH